MAHPHYSTAAGQIYMQQSAEQRIFDVCKTFNEMQTGPNPLTPDEVRKLIDRNPSRYSVLEAHATPKEK